MLDNSHTQHGDDLFLSTYTVGIFSPLNKSKSLPTDPMVGNIDTTTNATGTRVADLSCLSPQQQLPMTPLLSMFGAFEHMDGGADQYSDLVASPMDGTVDLAGIDAAFSAQESNSMNPRGEQTMQFNPTALLHSLTLTTPSASRATVSGPTGQMCLAPQELFQPTVYPRLFPGSASIGNHGLFEMQQQQQQAFTPPPMRLYDSSTSSSAPFTIFPDFAYSARSPSLVYSDSDCSSPTSSGACSSTACSPASSFADFAQECDFTFGAGNIDAAFQAGYGGALFGYPQGQTQGHPSSMNMDYSNVMFDLDAAECDHTQEAMCSMASMSLSSPLHSFSHDQTALGGNAFASSASVTSTEITLPQLSVTVPPVNTDDNGSFRSPYSTLSGALSDGSPDGVSDADAEGETDHEVQTTSQPAKGGDMDVVANAVDAGAQNNTNTDSDSEDDHDEYVPGNSRKRTAVSQRGRGGRATTSTIPARQQPSRAQARSSPAQKKTTQRAPRKTIPTPRRSASPALSTSSQLSCSSSTASSSTASSADSSCIAEFLNSGYVPKRFTLDRDGTKIYHCPISDCRWTVHRSPEVNRHFKKEHAGFRFKCCQELVGFELHYGCGKSFTRKDALTRHRRISCPRRPDAHLDEGKGKGKGNGGNKKRKTT